jgi:hypothetical protein
MIKRIIISVALAATLASCAAMRMQLDDGYQVGDGSRAAAETAQDYCKPRYTIIRFTGRWILRLIGYPVPDFCRLGQSIIE